MDGLAIAASLTEVRAAVDGGSVRSIYEPLRGHFVFHLFAGRRRKVMISPKLSSLHLTTLEIPNPETPSTYVMLLRKHLRGGRIAAIRQLGWDRVVEFDVQRRDSGGLHNYRLVVELIGLRGNVVLVRDGIVLGASRRDGRCQPGQPFQPLARQDRLDPRMIDAGELRSLLTSGDPARTLATSIDGVGRSTAEDIVRRAQSDDADGDFPERVHAALRDLLGCIETPKPHVDPIEMRAAFYPLPPPTEAEESFAEAVDRVLELGDALGTEAGEERSLRTQLLRARGKRERTAEKLRSWLDAANDASRLRHSADLLMTHRADVPRKAKEVILTEPGTDLAVTIPLAPSLDAIGNAQRLYERAKRMQRGVPRVKARLRRIEGELEMLDRGMTQLDAGEALPEGLISLLAAPTAPRSKLPFGSTPRRLEIDGYAVFVGRSAAENDRLLRDAAPDDIWMHVRRFAGSHVIVHRRGGGEVPDGVLRQAARLAGRHSKAGGERRVEVTVAAVKHVRKPKGAPPGLVIVDRADTLTVDLGKKENGE